MCTDRAVQTELTDASDQVVMDMMPLVRSIASRFSCFDVEFEELCQAGIVGLLDALHRYDSKHGAAFASYAFKFIEGEIRGFLRSRCMIHVTRAAKRNAAQAEMLRSELMHDEMRSISIADLAHILNINREEMVASLNAMQPCIPIDDERMDLGILGTIIDGTAIDSGQLIDRIAIKSALSSLPENEQRVIDLRYYHDMTQSQTATLLKISQSTVSKIERTALKKIAQSLKEPS